ncbi:MAG: sialate O-acetylesterase [Candidatus Latescibacteria bacterium]|nr:sialate O-acetylesterase [Candidatus Latescibacterota bacterium]
MKKVRRRSLSLLTLLSLFTFFISSGVSADVKLPHVIGANMVLQREVSLPIWGWADPGETITVTLGPSKELTKTGTDGRWKLKLPAMSAGGPFSMTVSGRNTITLDNILIGEVWICSGQSNMEMGITLINNAEEEIASADYPDIRLFHLARKTSERPLDDVNEVWKPCSPGTIVDAPGGWGGFSATAYFFGRELHRELGVPVGLIDTSWGGTRIEPWTPMEGFKSVDSLDDIIEHVRNANKNYKDNLPAKLVELETWISDTRNALTSGKDLPPNPEWPHHPLNMAHEPMALYNSMVYPLLPFAIRGAIWYQGEANRMDAMLYFEKMKALINGWRAVWDQGEFPFYFTQLAPFNYRPDNNSHILPGLWEAQTASLSIPNTGMAVTVDIGNIEDIHPKNKQEVGRRLSLWALAKTYGRSGIVYSGPLYRSMSVKGDTIVLRFNYAGSGLSTRDGKSPDWFEIAGEDMHFVKADARIDGDTVVVRNSSIKKPAIVRYAWHNEAEPNLINKEGLPASSFRTGTW